MKALFVIGIVLIVLGIASLVVPVPSKQRHGIEIGSAEIGIDTTQREKVHPAVSAILIAGGVALIIAGRRRRR